MSEPIVVTVSSTLTGEGLVAVSTILRRYTSVIVGGTGNVTATGLTKYKTVRGGLIGLGDLTFDASKFSGIRGDIKGSSTMTAFITDRNIEKDMRDYLPRYYGDIRTALRIIQAESNEFTRMNALINELLDQFYVERATWGLDKWEELAGINYVEARSSDSRRHFIEAKLRGVGAITKSKMKEIVDAFYESEITEFPSNFEIEIKLVGKRGIPKNLEDIEATIIEVIPAHIAHRYVFTWLPWGEVSESLLTWNDAETYTWDGLETAFLV